MMDTNEVAAYLRLKRRRIYELVRGNQIPCTRVTGKWLFPRAAVDRWLEQNTTQPHAWPAATPANSIAGSHDPLLEWAVRESRCGLALLPGGSLDGLDRLAGGEAVIVGMHVVEDDGSYNVATVRNATQAGDIVLIEWAWREQGLVVAAGNPLKLATLADVAKRKARLIQRQEQAGSQVLLQRLLTAAGLSLADCDIAAGATNTENELGLAIADGKADAGVAIRAVASQFRLDFVPLQKERFDLVMRRRDYFEQPMQTLFAFARSPTFAKRAAEFGGYDVSGIGSVVFNA